MNVNPHTHLDDTKILLGSLISSRFEYLCPWWDQKCSETFTESYFYLTVTSDF